MSLARRRSVYPTTTGRIKVPADGLPMPVPVDVFKGEVCTTLACEKCGWIRQATEDEIGLTDGLGVCEDDGCTGFLTWAYQDGDECPNCGKLGWFSSLGQDQLNGACSRPCMLQAEYAAKLKASA